MKVWLVFIWKKITFENIIWYAVLPLKLFLFFCFFIIIQSTCWNEYIFLSSRGRRWAISPEQLFWTIADSEGRTPLHWAVDRGHSNVVELLVSRNADIDVKVPRMYLTLYLLIRTACNHWSKTLLGDIFCLCHVS